MANSRSMAGLLASALLLMACTREVVIDIAKKSGQITFTASRPGAAKPPCVHGLIVTLAGTDIATTPSLWEISTAAPDRCRTDFVYGKAPPGYAQSGPAPVLLVGSRYMVEITGPGLQGGREFTVQAADGELEDTVSR